MVGKRGVTDEQLFAISVIERVCSIFSITGSIFVIGTFCSSRSFHKPINRLVFYASFGNLMSNVGTMMSRAYLDSPGSAGCQFQAFLLQMFMPADALWILAMAINVYLTFYYKFDARRLRKMEVPYLIVCYGIPFIPAFTYLFLKDHQGVRVYGNAKLWCLVTPEWDIFRILTFYGPVWVAILITFFIYIRAGRTIYIKRKQLYGFSSADRDPLSTLNGDIPGTVKTTEVSVTSEAVDKSDVMQLQSLNREGAQAPNGPYSVTISADVEAAELAQSQILPTSSTVITSEPATRDQRPGQVARRRNRDLNNAAWSYAKCSLLFFTAILITWIPSSANRVFVVVHKDKSSMVLEFMSAFVLPLQGFWNAIIYCTTSWGACKSFISDLRSGQHPEVRELIVGDARMPAKPIFRSPTRSGRAKTTFETESMTELANSRSPSDDGRQRS